MPKKPSVILGISSGHGDSSAALIVDGCLVAAAEEERFTRIKHYALFPKSAIEYCLQKASLTAAEVEAVAVARRPGKTVLRRMAVALRSPSAALSAKTRQNELALPVQLKQVGLHRAALHAIEHHFAHLMSAKILTNTEPLALLSLDGMGDFVSTMIGRAESDRVDVLDRLYFPHSLGFFYTAMTQYLGFPNYGDEFKVMGLSSYGTPKYLAEMKQLVREKKKFGLELNLEAFPILERPIQFSIQRSQPQIAPFFGVNFLTQLLGISPRKPLDPLTEAHWNLAASVQARFEEVGNHLLHQLFDRVGADTLALSGGCAHNSVWVGKIPRTTPFKRVFVAPASNDAGLAIGAAAAVAGGQIQVEGGHWALLGPSPSGANLETPAGEKITEQEFSSDASLIRWMVAQLEEGKILGVCRGGMELGPRALGNRSILADPREASMRKRLNERVKHREWFRPFAASILFECQDQWLKDSFYAPTMEAVFPVLDRVKSRIAGVVHVDGTCRIQSVEKKLQPFYWELIEAFRKKTGVPMLINTSFNDSEPIVATQEDALRCFLKTDLDYLVVNRRVFSKSTAEIALAG